MSEANGTPQEPPTSEAILAEILDWLPHLSDRHRGILRARLNQPTMVCRERQCEKPVGSLVVIDRPRPTATETE